MEKLSRKEQLLKELRDLENAKPEEVCRRDRQNRDCEINFFVDMRHRRCAGCKQCSKRASL